MSSTNELNKLVAQLAKLESNYQATNENVSKANVGWHVQHSLLVLNGVIQQISTSNPIEYKPIFSFIKLIILGVGKIPRGKGKSPKAVNPSTTDTTVNFQQLLSSINNKIIDIPKFNANQFFNHPLFGHLKSKTAIRFLVIHTNHHLAIINDILKLQK